jgi:hypothetical protein
MSQRVAEWSEQLFDGYEAFRENALSHRRFKQSAILPLIQRRSQGTLFAVSEAGRSFEGRTIWKLETGKGKQKVAFWSQMHGDEPTATMALFDIFNFLEAGNDGLDALRAHILDNLSLCFVPMLNPDGAERYQRATSQMIDMNRDALALQTPEARILKGLIEGFHPDFGFNLHDQNPRYTAGISPNLASLSFLATAYDYERSVNVTRKRAMQLIVGMNEVLQRFIPGQVGRFNDDHEPRAFGDNIQKWGTTLVLVESGGYVGDPEKQFIRKLNFVTLLTALAEIADGTYQNHSPQAYDAIPLNSRSVYNLVVRGVRVEGNGGYSIDVGINREEVNCENAQGFCYQSKVEEIGDLRTYFGLEELADEGLTIKNGNVHPEEIRDEQQLLAIDWKEALAKGIVFCRVGEGMRAQLARWDSAYPYHFLSSEGVAPAGFPVVGETPTFLLERNGQVRYAIVKGRVWEVGGEGIDG